MTEKLKLEKLVKELNNQQIELSQQIEALNNSAIVSETDVYGNIIFVNDMFCLISGYSRVELIGKNHRILKSGCQPDGMFDGMWKALSKGKVWKGEIMNKKKDGEFYWVDTTITPFKNADGKVYKYVGIRFDITNQKMQQELLKIQADELRAQQEELQVANAGLLTVSGELEKANRILAKKVAKAQISYQDLYESLSQDVFLINREGIVVNINRSGILLCGVDAKDILNGHYSKSPFLNEILGIDNNDVFISYFNENSIAIKDFEFKIENTNREVFYGGANVTLAIIDGKFNIQVSISDISDRKRTELALFESEAMNSGILSSLSSHISVIDNKGEIIAVNEAWNNFLKSNGENEFLETGVGSNYFEVCTNAAENGGEDGLRALLGIKSVMEGRRESFEMEYPCHSYNQQRWFIMSVTGFSGDNRKAVIRHIDISERKRKEDTIRALYDVASAVGGVDYFTNLSKTLCDLLNVKFAFIGEYLPSAHAVKTIGFCMDNSIQPNFEYLLKDTPCEQVVGRELCIYSQGVQNVFPKDKDLKKMGIESYIGIPLFREKAPIGLIVIMDDKPIIDYLFHQNILESITKRAETELERKQYEEQLERISSILEATSDFVGIASLDRKIVYMNTAGRKTVGYGAMEDISQLNIADFTPAFSQEIISKTGIPTAIKDGMWSGELKWKTKEGIDIPVSSVIIAHKNPKGEPQYISTISRDISVQKESERKLRNSEFVLSQAQRIGNIGSWEFDLKSRELIWSAEMYRIYNCDPKTFNLKGDSLINLTHQEDRKLLENWINALFSEKKEPPLNFRVLNPDNSIIHIRGDGEIIFDDDGNPIRAIGTAQDITVLKKAEQEIDSQKKFIEGILNNLPTDIVVFDVNHNYIFINPVGIKDDELRNWIIGKNDFDYCKFRGLDDSLAIKRRKLFEEAIHSKTDVQWIDEQITESGFTDYVLRKFHPLLENGKIKFVIGYGINITELKESEIQLRKTVVELNNRFNELQQFNYIVSHNLRGPVANILGLFNILNLPNASNEEKSKSIEYLQSAVMKMDELIKDLSVVLATRSSLNTKKEIVSIPKLLQSIYSSLEREIIESGTVIKMQINEDAKELSTVKSYIESILYNLLSNSIKYKANDLKPQILLSAKIENKKMVLTVSDNGIGIDLKKYGDQLFGLYKRFNTEVEGKGLGLHMIKTQVETLGGTVTVESEMGRGTTFVITLPII